MFAVLIVVVYALVHAATQSGYTGLAQTAVALVRREEEEEEACVAVGGGDDDDLLALMSPSMILICASSNSLEAGPDC